MRQTIAHQGNTTVTSNRAQSGIASITSFFMLSANLFCSCKLMITSLVFMQRNSGEPVGEVEGEELPLDENDGKDLRQEEENILYSKYM